MNRDEDSDRTEPWLSEAVELLRSPVERRRAAVDAVVLAAMQRPIERAHRRGVWHWLTQPRLVLSPLSAAGWLVTAGVLALLLTRVPALDAPPGAALDRVIRHQFVLVAPDARSVSLVGNFNAWSVGATPLVRRGDVWTVELALEPGRHVYSFVIDEREWVADASAPRAADDDFGRPSSVLIVEERGT